MQRAPPEPPLKVLKANSEGTVRGELKEVPAAAKQVLSPRAGCSWLAPSPALTPPGSPRAAGVLRTPTAPVTPPISSRLLVSTPNLRRAPLEPLLKALKANSESQARDVMKEDPDAAKEVFYDNDFEPPLCAAVRLGCNREVIGLLLGAGAHVGATNVFGYTALHLLSSGICPRVEVPPGEGNVLAAGGLASWRARWVERYEIAVATDLLAAGADPHGEVSNKPGTSCLEIARQAGKYRLVGLYTAA